MWDIGRDLGGNRTCHGCRKEQQQLQHILICKDVMVEMGKIGKDEWRSMETEESMDKMAKWIKDYIKQRESGMEESSQWG